MAAISPLPFMLAMLVAVALFAGGTYLLVRDEERHPVRWRSQAATVRTTPRLSHVRVAAISVVFALWSVWATARPVSGWR
jgi:hypothetical protein